MFGVMFLQNMSFCCSFITFSGINSGRDIMFCTNCGMSVGNAFSSDSLTSSLVCPVGELSCVMCCKFARVFHCQVQWKLHSPLMVYGLLAQQDVRGQVVYWTPVGGLLSQCHDKGLLFWTLILSQQEHWLFPWYAEP